jgi:hypothetical protein
MNKVQLLFLSLFGVLSIIGTTTQSDLKASSETAVATNYCPPLPPPAGNIININNQADLINQAYNAPANSTLLIAPGIYNMSNFLHIAHDGLTLRGQTGNRSDIILDFGGMVGGYFGTYIDADDVTIADLTIRNAADHGVSINGNDRPLLYNLHILDINDQFVKVNSPDDNDSDDGVLACSRLEYTSTAPNDYTNGISAHTTHGWIVRDNEWIRIRPLNDTDPNTTVPAVLFWSGATDTIVERNFFLDCSRGVALGLSNGHTGGIVRNNMFLFREPHDVAIELGHATDWLVAHNTAVLLNPLPGLTWGMEARFPDTQGTFANNLTNMTIWADRDGANATLTGNEVNAQESWFMNVAGGDLHLVGTGTAVIDQASPLPQVTDDFDGQTRPIGSAPDIGADEYKPFIPTDFVYLPIVIR